MARVGRHGSNVRPSLRPRSTLVTELGDVRFGHRDWETLVMPKHPAFAIILFDASVAFALAAPVRQDAPSAY